MSLDKIVEEGLNTAVEQHPLHPYTRALLSAIPQPDPQLELKAAGHPVACHAVPTAAEGAA